MPAVEVLRPLLHVDHREHFIVMREREIGFTAKASLSRDELHRLPSACRHLYRVD